MKKNRMIVCIVAAFGIAGGAMAQVAGPGGGAPKPGAEKHISRKEVEKATEEIYAKLHLSADQKAKLKAHAEEMKKKIADLRKGLKGAPDEDRKAKMKELRKANQEFLKQTLTKDQLRDFMKLRREKMKELRDKAKDIKPSV